MFTRGSYYSFAAFWSDCMVPSETQFRPTHKTSWGRRFNRFTSKSDRGMARGGGHDSSAMKPKTKGEWTAIKTPEGLMYWAIGARVLGSCIWVAETRFTAPQGDRAAAAAPRCAVFFLFPIPR